MKAKATKLFVIHLWVQRARGLLDEERWEPNKHSMRSAHTLLRLSVVLPYQVLPHLTLLPRVVGLPQRAPPKHTFICILARCLLSEKQLMLSLILIAPSVHQCSLLPRVSIPPSVIFVTIHPSSSMSTTDSAGCKRWMNSLQVPRSWPTSCEFTGLLKVF